MAERPILRECRSSLNDIKSNPNAQVLLFAHLARLPTPSSSSSPLISPSSLTTLLASFISVLDEPGLRASRGDECLRIVVEALLRLGPAPAAPEGEAPADDAEGGGEEGQERLREGVQSYLSARRVERELFGDRDSADQWEDVSDSAHLASDC